MTSVIFFAGNPKTHQHLDLIVGLSLSITLKFDFSPCKRYINLSAVYWWLFNIENDDWEASMEDDIGDDDWEALMDEDIE